MKKYMDYLKCTEFIKHIFQHIHQVIGIFGFASKNYDPVKDLNAERWNNLNIDTKYYNTELHSGCFALPNYVKKLLEVKKK